MNSNALTNGTILYPSLSCLGPVKYAVGNISPKNKTSVVDNKIATRNDNFYAWRCLKHLGIDTADGVVRLSMAHYNSHEDKDQLLSALKKL